MSGLLTLVLFLASFVLVSSANTPDGAGLCELISRGQLNYLSFFPCLPDSNSITPISEQCDPFLYTAALIAANAVGQHPSLLKYPKHDLNFTVKITAMETKGDVTLSTFKLIEHIEQIQRGRFHAVLGASVPSITEHLASLAVDRLHLLQDYITGSDDSDYQFGMTRIVSVAYMEIKLGQIHVASQEGQNNAVDLVTYADVDHTAQRQQDHTLLHGIVPSQIFLNIGRLHALNIFKWRRVGVFSSSEDNYPQISESFVSLGETFPGIKVIYFGSFSVNPNFILQQIFSSDVKIIIAMFSEEMARTVLCQASGRNGGANLTDADHVWILPSYFNPFWWKLSDKELRRLSKTCNCSNDDMVNILDSMLSINFLPYNYLQPNIPLDITVGKTLEDLIAEGLQRTKELYNTSNELPHISQSLSSYVYDSVWAVAQAWDSVIPLLLENSTFCLSSEGERIMDMVSRALLNVNFAGTSGEVDFRSSPDSQETIVIQQYVGGVLRAVSLFGISTMKDKDLAAKDVNFTPLVMLGPNSVPENILPSRGYFFWKGSMNNQQPRDGTRISQIGLIEFGVICVAVLIGVSFSTVLFIVNIVFRNFSKFKAYSPRLNIINIAGFTIVMPISILIAISSSKIPLNISDSANDVICQLIIWMEGIGLNLGFGTLLAKNWRIHRIFHNRKLRHRVLLNPPHPQNNITDVKLLPIIFIVSLPTLCFLIIWTATNPVHSETILLRDGVVIITHCSCSRFFLWNLILSLSTLIPVILLVYFAYKNQKIDSHLTHSETANRFTEEGQGSARVVMIILMFQLMGYLAGLVVFVLADVQYPSVQLIIWISLSWSLLVPVILLTVLYIPKIFTLYQSHKESLRRLQIYSHYRNITKEVLNDDHCQRNVNSSAHQISGKHLLENCKHDSRNPSDVGPGIVILHTDMAETIY